MREEYETMDRKREFLNQYFGYTDFRGGQEELIDAILTGRDALGIMPTGGGKSICYQLPALMLPGITLVISPLISLMKDQVMALENAGIPAAFINSSLSFDQIKYVCYGMRTGRYKIIYAAPERLLADGFVSLAQEINISMVAVDEAHCISQWGQDFRPSYLKILEFLEKLPHRPIISAFTATATSQVRDDIERILELRSPVRVITGFDRPNLSFEVLTPKNRSFVLRQLVHDRRDRNGIVYCSTRRDVESVCDELCEMGISATRYHAGLEDDERRRNQDDFIYDRKTVMVATNAFGMGIDKSNVSYVIHYNMPKSLEAYYQEAGRAGRDGRNAECILIFSNSDIHTAMYMIQNPSENEELTEEERKNVMMQDMARLRAMIGYCKTADCLRAYILNYFSQKHGKDCGNCGNCKVKTVLKDITRESQMILSCVKRIKDHTGFNVGATIIVRVLHGSHDKRVLELGLNRISTYGLLEKYSRPEIRQMMDHLEMNGYIFTDPEYSTVHLAEKAREVLFGGSKVMLPVRESMEQTETKTEEKKTEQEKKPIMSSCDNDLLVLLKECRTKLAKLAGVPAYIVFSDASLVDMATKKPTNIDKFMLVSGVGDVKAARFGKQFLKVINEHLARSR